MLDGWGPTPGRGGRADKWRLDGRRLVGVWGPGRTKVRWRHAHRSAPRRVDLDRESPRQKAWCLIAPPERPQRVDSSPRTSPLGPVSSLNRTFGSVATGPPI